MAVRVIPSTLLVTALTGSSAGLATACGPTDGRPAFAVGSSAPGSQLPSPKAAGGAAGDGGGGAGSAPDAVGVGGAGGADDGGAPGEDSGGDVPPPAKDAGGVPDGPAACVCPFPVVTFDGGGLSATPNNPAAFVEAWADAVATAPRPPFVVQLVHGDVCPVEVALGAVISTGPAQLALAPPPASSVPVVAALGGDGATLELPAITSPFLIALADDPSGNLPVIRWELAATLGAGCFALDVVLTFVVPAAAGGALVAGTPLSALLGPPGVDVDGDGLPDGFGLELTGTAQPLVVAPAQDP